MVNFIIIAALFVIAALSSGCQSAVGTTSSNSTTTSNTNTAKPAEPKKEEPVASTDPVVTGSLATPAEAYKTAYELRKNRDIAGLKKIMSKDMQEFLTMMAEDEKKSLDVIIKEMCDKPQADKAATRNEKIKGDRAEIEYLTETGSWKTMDFEKVDGKWLLSLPMADKSTGPESEK